MRRSPGLDWPLVRRGLLYAVLWWILTDGSAEAWWIGIPTVLAAVGVSSRLPATAAWRVRPLGALRFAGHFALYVVWGGLDVAARALDPRLPLAPQVEQHRLLLPEGPARTFLVNVLSLMPGTLSADVQQDCLTLHVLDRNRPLRRQLQLFEQLVGSMFDVPLAAERKEGI